MANAFEVRVPDVMQAFLGFDQSYKDARANRLQDQQQQARAQAAQMIQSGVDPKQALGILLGAGDVQGAQAYGTITDHEAQRAYQDRALAATVEHNKALERQSGAQLSATLSHYRALEGQAAATLAETKAEHERQLGKPVPVETLGGTKFLVRGPNGAMSLVDPASLAGGGAPGPAPAASQIVAPAGGPAPAVAPGRDAAPAPLVAPAAVPNAPTVAPDLETIDEKTGKREGFLKSLPPDVQDYVKKVANYEIDPRTSSTKGGKREQLLSAVAKYDPTFNQQDYPILARNRQAFDTGKHGDTVRSLNVVTDHLATYRDLALALKNGDIQLFNTIAQKFAEATGSAAPTNLKMAGQIVGSELIKALGVAGAGTAEERAALGHNLSIAASPEQAIGTVDSVARPLLAGQLKGLRKQYTDTTRRSEEEFNKKLFPSTMKFMTEGEGGAGTATVRPPQPAIKYLQAHPEYKEAFDAKYGAGSAAKVLGGQ